MNGVKEVSDSIYNFWLTRGSHPRSKLLTQGQDSDLGPGSYQPIKWMGFMEVPLLKILGWDAHDKQDVHRGLPRSFLTLPWPLGNI